MSAFILQSLILLAIAFVVGFLLGLVFQRWRRVMKAKASRGVHGVAAGGAGAPAPVGAGLAHAVNGAAGPAAGMGEGAAVSSPGYESNAPSEGRDALPTGAGTGSGKDSSATARTVPTEDSETSDIGSEDGAGAAGADKGSGAASGSAQADDGASATGRVSSVPNTAGRPAAGAVASGAGAGAKSTPAPADSGEATYPGRRPPAEAAPETGGVDDLKKLKGIGPQNEQRLNALGIYHFRQIAAWTEEEAQWVGSYLAFPGRIEREDWIGQAKAILSGTKPEDLKLPSRRRQ